MNLLQGKTAMITGAAGGIGAATARRFAEEGAAGMLVADINIKLADEVAKEIEERTGCKCIPVRTDVACEQDVKAASDLMLDIFGTLDILVNSAGVCNTVDIDKVSMCQWDRTMDINLKGTFLFSREALKIMKTERKGRIVNVASQAGKVGGLVAGPDYSASKAGVICLTKTLAKAAALYNINVNSVAPGLINTEMTKDFGYDNASVPLGRIGTPEEVADVVVFLASGMSAYITGACIDVNGGMTMW